MIEWITNNKEWIFSGFGVAIIGFIFSYFFKNGSKSIIRIDDGSKVSGIISGGNINSTSLGNEKINDVIIEVGKGCDISGKISGGNYKKV